jgi:hypothetical protein
MNLPKIRISIPVGLNGTLDHRIGVFLWWLGKERDGKTCDIELEITADKPVCQTRNRQSRHFLKGEADHVLFMDRDCIPDLHGFDLLVEAIQKPDVDAVAGWSVMHWQDNKCVPMIINPKGMTEDKKHAEIDTNILGLDPGLYDISGRGVATHCLMVSRHVLQKFWDDGTIWFEDILCSDPKEEDKFGARIYGHDILFCTRMVEKGFKLWLDTRVFWGHVKPIDMRSWFLDNILRQQEIHSHANVVRVLRRMWGNFGYTAPEDFLLRLCLEAQKIPDGTVAFECGTGLTTMVLQEVIPGRYLAVEDQREWYDDFLEKDGVNGEFSIAHTPLKDFGEYEWYDLPDLKGMKISLVLCDGPRQKICKGGRIGVLQRLKPYLTDTFTMMVDDAHITQGHDSLVEWKKDLDFNLKYERLDCAPDGVNPPRKFVVVRGEKVNHGD